MVSAADEFWIEHVRQTLQAYDESLLRQVAGQLCRTRNQWPREELVERSLATLGNPPVLDRRLKDLDLPGRQLLSLIGRSRLVHWPLGNLVEMLVALGQADGLAPVRGLLDAGLLFPELRPGASVFAETAPNNDAPLGKLKKLDQWLTYGTGSPLHVFTHPLVGARGKYQDLEFPPGPDPVVLPGEPAAVREADGLEWPLRLAILWQRVSEGPLRRTQQGDFFKRDRERLQEDPLLAAPPSDHLADVADPGLLVVAWALSLGILVEQDGEIRAGAFPEAWNEGLAAALADLWTALLRLQYWNIEEGWKPEATPGNPYPSAYFLSLWLLGRLPENGWTKADSVSRWIRQHHPYWAPADAERAKLTRKTAQPAPSMADFLLGLAYPLKIVQATKDADGEWLVRLSPLGQWLLGFKDTAPASPAFPQTLLVQPSLEILAYRQGLTPELMTRLSRFASWKGLSAACTLQLEPHTVYRSLEAGETFTTILQTLERHGMKATPTSVVEALRTWSNKRERISVYPAGALFEFASAADLNDALARGLPATRLTERLAIVANEEQIDYRHFRLKTRDFSLPPERCVEIEDDGVTLAVDAERSDLLLETELVRFAESVSSPGVQGKRSYRLTPVSLAQAHAQGFSVGDLETWFRQRTGQALPPAARLLLAGGETPAPSLRRQLVLHLSAAELADGLMQYPPTRDLIAERLGPTTLAVAEENLPLLRERFREIGMPPWEVE